jgi:hypothetical protein
MHLGRSPDQIRGSCSPGNHFVIGSQPGDSEKLIDDSCDADHSLAAVERRCAWGQVMLLAGYQRWIASEARPRSHYYHHELYHQRRCESVLPPSALPVS